VFSKKVVDRIIRYAFNYAKSIGKRKVTSVDKANILFTSQFWRGRFEEIAREYPGFETESIYVDAMSQYLIRCPERYGVVVTDNMFGDILSDETAQIVGSLGLCAGANLNPETKAGMFEPIHGSAPDIAGKGIANPTSAILSVAMMLGFLGEGKAAQKVEKAVEAAMAEGVRTIDIAQGMPWLPTAKFGDEIIKRIKPG
jgi:3-isopropylmalate dehydrogenase